VLIVDDEPDMADMLAIGLDRPGYDVAAVNDLGSAVRVRGRSHRLGCRGRRPVDAPHARSGLLHRLKTVRPTLKTVLCTGFSDGVEGELVESGAIDFFVQSQPTPKA
jgi:DNA-binding NtrC family response regulator